MFAKRLGSIEVLSLLCQIILLYAFLSNPHLFGVFHTMLRVFFLKFGMVLVFFFFEIWHGSNTNFCFFKSNTVRDVQYVSDKYHIQHVTRLSFKS